MWVSPNHPNPPRPAGPPPDEGHELATVKRSDGHELRVRLKVYEGHPYVLIQLWSVDASGAAWPVKGRSTSVRMAEIGDVIEGLQAALEPGQGPPMTEHHAAEQERPTFIDRGRPQRPDWRERQLPKLEGGAGDFDEFAGQAPER